ncbi:sigma-70 family RNA polymerase sigma factor [Pseudalkalibacillus salsuginis]|uniref:sigma-70 family RNA polymerase sigma factor n=1 Tax=Pseudalkalibacillus salsuginis TaxID=2910972 RepID=UPI001F37EB3F|nr:sigma-70 family RNA polymerase sigma factor [Pseudalkalibacillus salsuginis]MCF6408928.1 RNA polymerase sigma factor [Pseudalkalibacillus salsuginis]
MEELVKKAKKGDEDAFMEIIYTHKKLLYHIAFRYFQNEHDALEAIQETTYRAYRSIRKLKDPSSAKSWLLKILTNYCLNEIRKKKRTITNGWFLEKEEITGELDLNVSIDLKNRIFDLKRNLQKVILLKYYQGFTTKEIAQILDKPESTIKTWVYKGLKQLRQQMEKEGAADER